MNFLLILLLLVASIRVAKAKIKKHVQSGEEICNYNGFKLVEAKFGKESHLLCLKLKSIASSSVANHQSALLLDPDLEEIPEDQNYIQAYPLSEFNMADGYPLEDPASGSAEGYIGDDDHFYGVLHLANRTLYADPYNKDDLRKFFGAFENDNMAAPPRKKRDHAQSVQLDLDRRYLPYQIEDRSRIYGTARARICDLLLLADREFFVRDANSSLNHVVTRMMHAVTQADIIFRNADFNEDGIPDNIGFTVKYILVLTSNDTNSRVFGSLLNSRAVDGREYLMKFARLRRLSEVCLGIAFSGHAFYNRTLGLSFTSLGGGLGGAAGGLCDRRAYGRSFNTLAIAHATTEDDERVPERIAALTLAHEMGHSFGAHHDDNFPNPECSGYLMGSQSSTSENGRFFEFSLCSKRLIASTLSSMSYCFTEEAKPYCGNGIVEEGEACDCGLPSRCSRSDPCCTPRAGGALIFDERMLHKNGCSVAPIAKCHPSQGLCCMPNCQFADLSKSGIDCKTRNDECRCTNDTASCMCGLGGRCLNDGSCHAAECALLGLKECQCFRSPGGALGDSRMCGICCQLEGPHQSTKCVGAEQAAYEAMQKTRLPPGWPGDDYIGPNVTVRLCTDGRCKMLEMRAWPFGSACVTRGAVGMCNARGVCTRVLHTPRSNIYPDVMRVKIKSSPSSPSSARTNSTLFLILMSVLHLFYILN